MLAADMRIDGAPSIFFDAVVLVVSDAGAEELVKESAAIISSVTPSIIGYVHTRCGTAAAARRRDR